MMLKAILNAHLIDATSTHKIKSEKQSYYTFQDKKKTTLREFKVYKKKKVNQSNDICASMLKRQIECTEFDYWRRYSPVFITYHTHTHT